MGVTGRQLSSLIGLDRSADQVIVRRYRAAIPQLVLGHLDRMETVRSRLEELPGLLLAGNYLTGVGLKDALASGRVAARVAAEILAGQTT